MSGLRALTVFFLPGVVVCDRPEIKQDGGETIPSPMADGTRDAFLNITRQDYSHAFWQTCPGPKSAPGELIVSEEFNKNPSAFLYDSLPEATFHALDLFYELPSAPSSRHQSCRGALYDVKGFTKDPGLAIPSLVLPSKIFVPLEADIEDVITANVNMVTEENRCYGSRAFISGFVLQHVKNKKYMVLYNVYSEKNYPSCSKAEETTAYKGWKEQRHKWLALPTQINQGSPLLVSKPMSGIENPLADPSTHVEKPLFDAQDKPLVKGLWSTCNVDEKPTVAIATAVWQMNEMHDKTLDIYYVFQLFEKAHTPDYYTPEKSVGDHIGQCRYQDLDVLFSKEKAKTGAFDESDFVIHTEYEIRGETEQKKFEAATKTLIRTSLYYKQAILLTSGEFNDNRYYHYYEVFNEEQDQTDHSTSEAFEIWKKERSFRWVKLTDGFAQTLTLRNPLAFPTIHESNK